MTTVMPLYERLTEAPRQSFFLLGMRGVGKSTWARTAFPGAAYVDLLDERLYQDLLVDPSLFAQSIGHLPPAAWVVVDEVQRLPALLNEVHRFIETHRLRFALLGSSARKLKAAGTNLLAGRALRQTMFPLTAAELGAEFDLDGCSVTGRCPSSGRATRPARSSKPTRNFTCGKRSGPRPWSAICPASPAFCRWRRSSTVRSSTSRASRATPGSPAPPCRATSTSWRTRCWSTDCPRTKPGCACGNGRAPKLYWVDPGVVRAVKRQLGEIAAEERGPLLESWVVTTLRAHAEAQDLYDEMWYWAPHQTAVEVDLLLRRGGELLAIEVKAAAVITPAC